MTDIKSMNKEELKDLMVQVGEKAFSCQTDLQLAS